MNVKQPDFPNVIRHLEKSGLTQRQIAEQTGTSAAQVNRIKNYDQVPNYYLGESLLFLSSTVTDK